MTRGTASNEEDGWALYGAQHTYYDGKRAVSRSVDIASGIQTSVTPVADDSHYKYAL